MIARLPVELLMGINGLNLNPGSSRQREVKSKLVPSVGQSKFWRAIPQKKGRGESLRVLKSIHLKTLLKTWTVWGESFVLFSTSWSSNFSSSLSHFPLLVSAPPAPSPPHPPPLLYSPAPPPSPPAPSHPAPSPAIV